MHPKQPYFTAFKVVASIFVIGAFLLFIAFSVASCAMNNEPVHYYRVQRLNIFGEVQQTYYSRCLPESVNNNVFFREYPSKKWIQFSAPYTAEDIGTNKP